MFPKRIVGPGEAMPIVWMMMFLFASPSRAENVIVSAKMRGYPRTGCPGDELNPPPTLRNDTSDVLTRLRSEMSMRANRADKFDAHLVPDSDAHQSPVLAERDKRVQFLSGFTGRKAVAIITIDKAAIWVDPMDAAQADEEIHCHWVIYTNSKNDVSIPQWVQVNLRARSRIGVDATLISQAQWEALSKRITLIPVRNNIVDHIWAASFFRPSYTEHHVTVHSSQYNGKPWIEKVTDVRRALTNESCDTLIVTALDEISWVLNIRSRETEYFPAVRAYLIITATVIYMYTDASKLSQTVNGTLKVDGCYNANCVKVVPYENLWGDLKTMSTQVWSRVWVPGEAPYIPGSSRAIFDIIHTDKLVKVSPIATLKSVKNSEERKGMSNAHLRDAIAFCEFMAYVESKMKTGEEWDEHKAAMTLDQFRREQPLSQGISFKTVVAFGAHSASPHHNTQNMTSIKMDASSLLLISSGGQYLDGTTDLTRTYHFGKPTDEEIFVHTKVLMGLIDLASATFPDSMTLQEADVLARNSLWDDGLHYNHPTGHGIGSYMSVEEGPLIIGQDDHPKQKFQDGYFISAGPAHYEEGRFGIRLKNVLEVVPSNKFQNESLRLLTFRSATLVPFEPKLIDKKLLSPKHIAWLNEYNRRIREEVGAELKKQTHMKGFYWIMDKAQMFPDSRCSASSLFSSFHLLILVICYCYVTYGL